MLTISGMSKECVLHNTCPGCYSSLCHASVGSTHCTSIHQCCHSVSLVLFACTCRNLEDSLPRKRLRSHNMHNVSSAPSPTSQTKSGVTTWHSYHRKRRGCRGRGPVPYIDPISTRTRSQNTISIERGKFFSIGINMFEPVRRRRTKTNSSSTDGISSPLIQETRPGVRRMSRRLLKPAPEPSENEDVFEDSSSEEEERESVEKGQAGWSSPSSPLRYPPKSAPKITFSESDSNSSSSSDSDNSDSTSSLSSSREGSPEVPKSEEEIDMKKDAQNTRCSVIEESNLSPGSDKEMHTQRRQVQKRGGLRNSRTSDVVESTSRRLRANRRRPKRSITADKLETNKETDEMVESLIVSLQLPFLVKGEMVGSTSKVEPQNKTASPEERHDSVDVVEMSDHAGSETSEVKVSDTDTPVDPPVVTVSLPDEEEMEDPLPESTSKESDSQQLFVNPLAANQSSSAIVGLPALNRLGLSATYHPLTPLSPSSGKEQGVTPSNRMVSPPSTAVPSSSSSLSSFMTSLPVATSTLLPQLYHGHSFLPPRRAFTPEPCSGNLSPASSSPSVAPMSTISTDPSPNFSQSLSSAQSLSSLGSNSGSQPSLLSSALPYSPQMMQYMQLLRRQTPYPFTSSFPYLGSYQVPYRPTLRPLTPLSSQLRPMGLSPHPSFPWGSGIPSSLGSQMSSLQGKLSQPPPQQQVHSPQHQGVPSPQQQFNSSPKH